MTDDHMRTTPRVLSLLILAFAGCATSPNHQSEHTASLCVSYLFPVSREWHEGVRAELRQRDMTHDDCTKLLRSMSRGTSYSGSVRTYCIADPKRPNTGFENSSYCLEDFQYRRILVALDELHVDREPGPEVPRQ